MAIAETADDLRPFPLRDMVSGSVLICLLFASFTLWTASAPIDGAVVSPGIISVASFRKQIQHLEGGIVEKNLRPGRRPGSKPVTCW